MSNETYFEQVPLEEIKHIIAVEPVVGEKKTGLFSVRFAWAENHRFFYQVFLVDEDSRTFTVWIDGVQEGKWGTPVPTNGRESLGTCQKPIERWCRLNFDQLPANGDTKQIFLNGIPR